MKYFLKFDSPEQGRRAAEKLLSKPFYANRTVDDAMKTWSNGGYGADGVPDIAKKKVFQLTTTEKKRMMDAMLGRSADSQN